MKIRYLAHASFLIENKDGVRIITDPYKPNAYDGGIKYDSIDEEADIVTVTHTHEDHNFTEAVKGNPEIVNTPERREIKGIVIEGFKTYHDPNQGKDRGENIIFSLDIDNIKLVHCGDLGDVNADLSGIKDVDILLIPVGGHFTINADEAYTIVNKLKPKIVIPMHYKTEKTSFPIENVQKFISKFERVKHIKDKEISFTTLPETLEVWVLPYTK